MSALLYATIQFIQSYYGLNLRDALNHWYFILSSCIILLLTGSLLLLLGLSLKSFNHLLASIPLVLFGSYLGHYYRANTWLPANKLVIAIARFSPISSAAQEDADNFTHRLIANLTQKEREGAPIEIRRLPDNIRGMSDPERLEFAKKLGNSPMGLAHIIIWGEVRKDQGELYVKPTITIARQFDPVHIQEPNILQFTNIEPEHIRFEELLASNISDLVVFIYGLAYYQHGDYESTFRILDHVHTRDGYFYAGMSHYRLNMLGPNRSEELKRAIEKFDAALSTGARSTGKPSYPFDLWILFNRANALSDLSPFLPRSEAVFNLKSAIETYRSCLDPSFSLFLRGTADGISFNSRFLFPQNKAMVHDALAQALSNLAPRQSSGDAMNTFHAAAAEFSTAIEFWDSTHYTGQWGRLTSNLATTYIHMGENSVGDSAANYLRTAISLLKSVHELHPSSPDDLGLAAALFYLSQLDLREGNIELNYCIALCQGIVEANSRTSNPFAWGCAYEIQGNAYATLASISSREKRLQNFLAAAQSYQNAIDAFAADKFPLNRAHTLANYARLCLNVNNIGTSANPDTFLVLSLKNSEEALTIREFDPTSSEYKNDKLLVAQVRSELGGRVGGSKGVDMLKEVLLALNDLTSEPRLRAPVHIDMALAFNKLGFLAPYPMKREYFDQAIRHSDTAASDPGFIKRALALKQLSIHSRDSILTNIH